MASHQKKRAIDISRREETSSDGFSEDEIAEKIEIGEQEKIQVEFEGRTPDDSDFHGIKQLLQQLFLKAHINLSDLTNLIISQNYVGSVVKQSEIENDSGDEDDEDDANDVFGITTIVNLSEKQNEECVQQLRNLLEELCEEHDTYLGNTFIRSLLSEKNTVGLLINERFINIPAQIAVPLLESLIKEIQRAKTKNLPFDFSYFIIICKLYKIDRSNQKKKSSGKNKKGTVRTDEQEIIWSNPEEEVFDQEADCYFEFSVKDESDSGLSGNWLEDDVVMVPYRRVLFLSADKLETVIQRIIEFVSPQ